jgi:hypothetical protein
VEEKPEKKHSNFKNRKKNISLKGNVRPEGRIYYSSYKTGMILLKTNLKKKTKFLIKQILREKIEGKKQCKTKKNRN